MANDAVFVTSVAPVVTINFLIWKGPIRLKLQSIYQLVDQDGSVGSEKYSIDKRPKDYEVEVWGTPTVGAVLGIFDLMDSVVGRSGTLTFFDSVAITNLKMLDVEYIAPIGIGTSAGTNSLEACLSLWSKEK